MTEGKNGQIGYLIRDRAPNARTGSTARVVWTVIGAVLLIPVLVIGGFAISLYNAVGGTAHTATDDTVRVARTKAAESARVEVDQLVRSISPILAQPTLRAFIDVCEPVPGPDHISNDIICERVDHLFYSAASEPTGFRAIDLALPIARQKAWQINPPDKPCTRTEAGQTGACMVTDTELLRVLQNDATSVPSTRMPPMDRAGQVEGDGFPELSQMATVGPGVLVMYAVTYFQG